MITDMLKQFREKEKASFHMPGHKNGMGLTGAPLLGNFYDLDTTELPGTDALIEPTDAILRAEQCAATLYGAKHSFFLVNGSTGGILAMIYSAFHSGDKVIIDRNCHQSVLNGAILSGICPVYITPESTPLPDVCGTLSPRTIERALKEHSDIKGAILTSPNYFGKMADISEIAALLHRHNALLLVDEAHGAHFPFSNLLPVSAVSLGADMSVVSLHKTLPSPNQTALLNIGKSMDVQTVRDAVRIFQTSSPSYPLLSAMEYALHFAAEKGAEKTARLSEWIAPLACPSLDDPLKLMPSWAEKGISGYLAEEILRERFGIYVELCTAHRILCMASWCNTKADIERLAEGFTYLNNLLRQGEALRFPAQMPETITCPKLTPAEATRTPHTLLPLKKAAGKICGKAISVFPPCIPVVLPGEIITEMHMDYIENATKNHATVTGMTDGMVTVVQ